MNRKSTSEIEAEISLLITMKPDVRSHSAFGDDHHAAIAAQVKTLEERLTETDIWDDDWTDNERDAAIDARRWLAGDSDTAPSEVWKDLLL